jgi:antitoxin VapB
MALTLKNLQVEALANEVAALTGETKTEAVRKALLERRERVRSVRSGVPKRDLGRFLETHVWPVIPANVLGREVSKEEVEEYLGFGPGGV